MAGELSTKGIIRCDDLREIADARLKEAELLARQGYHGACIYLAGYSVECYLKCAICRRLDLDELPAMFGVHDLKGLRLCSGLDKQFRSDAHVEDNFRRICSVWPLVGKRNVRYRPPNEFTPDGAKKFLSYINDPVHGVVVWLKKNIH